MCHLICVPFGSSLISSLLQRAVYESVFCIHYGCLAVLVGVFHHVGPGFVAGCDDCLRVCRRGLYQLFGVLVFLQQFYCKITGRVFVAQSLFLLYLALNGFYTFFYIGAVVDVYVSEHIMLWLHT